MSEDVKVKRGTVVVFSSGEYSDYSVRAVMVAVDDITEAHYREAIASEINKDQYRQEYYAVVSNLVKMGLLVDVNSVEVWMGAYGEVSREFNIS